MRIHRALDRYLRPMPILFLLSLGLAACTAPANGVGGPASATHGKQLIETMSPPMLKCGGCHTIPGIQGADGTVGPNLAEIGITAGYRVPNLTAQEYIFQSIHSPTAHTVPGYPVLMPNFSKWLSDQDIDDITAYLLTLR